MQAAILLLSGGSIWLVTRQEVWRRWGYPLGLASQPLWIYETYQEAQWGMFALSLWYCYAWGQGIYFHWIKRSASTEPT